MTLAGKVNAFPTKGITYCNSTSYMLIKKGSEETDRKWGIDGGRMPHQLIQNKAW